MAWSDLFVPGQLSFSSPGQAAIAQRRTLVLRYPKSSSTTLAGISASRVSFIKSRTGASQLLLSAWPVLHFIFQARPGYALVDMVG